MDTLKSYFAHLGLYVNAAYMIASAIDPTHLPPSLIPYLLGATTVLGMLHQVFVAPSTAPTGLPPPSAGSIGKLHWLTVVIALVLTLPLLHGCSVLAKITAPTSQPYIVAAVDVAVATAEAKGIPAAQINAIAKQALAADSGTAASLAAISTLVNTQLAELKLPAGDLAAAQILEDALAVAIQAQIGANPNVAQAQAAIAAVLNAVIEATAVTS